jgi:hypothetical protein
MCKWKTYRDLKLILCEIELIREQNDVFEFDSKTDSKQLVGCLINRVFK